MLERLDVELASGSTMGSAVESAKGSTIALDDLNEPCDAWCFVETLRALRHSRGSEGWLLVRDGRAPLLWVRADGASYLAEPQAVQAIRSGGIPQGELTLRHDPYPPADLQPRPGIELCWFFGYYASDLPAPWLDSTAHYRITRWPNFGVIRPLPSHIRVAASLSANSGSLLQIAARANISIEEATRTLNALASCEIVKAVQAEETITVPALEPLIQARGGFTGFLKNLRRHLGLGAPA
jgi:hypothetical protein